MERVVARKHVYSSSITVPWIAHKQLERFCQIRTLQFAACKINKNILQYLFLVLAQDNLRTCVRKQQVLEA